MSPAIVLVLQITVIGMGLVFGALILFWGLMAGLVRLLPEADPAPASAAPPPPPAEAALRQQAAALAVAVALAEAEAAAVPMLSRPAASQVSPWQAVMRANQLSQRGPVR